MNNPKRQAANSDLEAMLEQLETGTPGRNLRAAGEGLGMPPAAAQRLQSRLYRTIGATTAAAPRRGFGEHLPRRLSLPALPRFALGTSLMLAIAVVMAIVLGAGQTPTVSAAALIRKAEQQAAIVVEPGKVRHIVREVSTESKRGKEKYVAEIWLAQGETHLLDRWAIWDAQPGKDQLQLSHLQVIGEQVVWTFIPATNIVYQAPFASCSLDLAQWIGDRQFLAELSRNPKANATVAGTEQIGGVTTRIVEVEGARMWIDPETGRIMQAESANNYPGSESVTVERVTVDETMDRAAAPQDLFSFTPPDGADLRPQDTPMCSKG